MWTHLCFLFFIFFPCIFHHINAHVQTLQRVTQHSHDHCTKQSYVAPYEPRNITHCVFVLSVSASNSWKIAVLLVAYSEQRGKFYSLVPVLS